jgi:hypothetical protein
LEYGEGNEPIGDISGKGTAKKRKNIQQNFLEKTLVH